VPGDAKSRSGRFVECPLLRQQRPVERRGERDWPPVRWQQLRFAISRLNAFYQESTTSTNFQRLTPTFNDLAKKPGFKVSRSRFQGFSLFKFRREARRSPRDCLRMPSRFCLPRFGHPEGPRFLVDPGFSRGPRDLQTHEPCARKLLRSAWSFLI